MTIREWIKDKLAFLAVVAIAAGAFLLSALFVPFLVFPGVRRWLAADGLHDAALEEWRRKV